MSPSSGSGTAQGAGCPLPPGSRPPPVLSVPLRAMLSPQVPAAAASLRAGRSWTSSDFGGRGREGAARARECFPGGRELGRSGADGGRCALVAGAARAEAWDEGPKSAARGGAWPRLRPRLPQGRRGLPLAADGRGLAASPTRGCAPGRGTGDQGFGEARAPAGPVAVRASRRTPDRAQPWEENVVVTRVAATCRTSPTPRISCLRALTLPEKALNCARGVWVFLLWLPWGESWGEEAGRRSDRVKVADL